MSYNLSLSLLAQNDLTAIAEYTIQQWGEKQAGAMPISGVWRLFSSGVSLSFLYLILWYAVYKIYASDNIF